MGTLSGVRSAYGEPEDEEDAMERNEFTGDAGEEGWLE
jgi:hypothetical protein